MKKTIVTIVCLFLACQLWSAAPGDKLLDIRGAHNYQYKAPINVGIPVFPDLKTAMLSYSQKFTPPGLLCALSGDQVIATFGVLDGSKDNAYFVIDLDGDGSLDYKSDENYLPNWVLFRLEMKREYPAKFLETCNAIYQIFNSTKGPNQGVFAELLKPMADKLQDPQSPNRDLYYSLISFSYYNAKPAIALGIITSLNSYIAHEFHGDSSPLFLLYQGETQINLGQVDSALATFKRLKTQDPKSLIADFYIAKLQDQNNKTDSALKAFAAANPQFWTLKPKAQK